MDIATKVEERTLLLQLTISKLGNSRKIDTRQIEVKADKTLVKASKKLFDCKEYKDIGFALDDLKKWVLQKSVPSFYRKGIYRVPLDSVQQVEEVLQEAVSDLGEVVDPFVARYEEFCIESRRRLDELANRDDYPTVDQVRTRFGVSWAWLPSPDAPDKLREINVAAFTREREKIRASLEEAAENIKIVLRQQLQELVGHMVNMCSPDEKTGARKRMYGSTLDNLKEFLDELKNRNVVDDIEVSSLAEKAKDIISGVNIEDIKDMDSLRKKVVLQFTDIKTKLDTLLINKPSRVISLEDE